MTTTEAVSTDGAPDNAPENATDDAKAKTLRLINAFRIVAIAEAISWGALLIAMLFKYVVADFEGGVKLVGPIHGTLFLAYMALTLIVGTRLRWGAKIIIVGVFAAVPPFMTVVFEKWVARTGRLRADATFSG